MLFQQLLFQLLDACDVNVAVIANGGEMTALAADCIQCAYVIVGGFPIRCSDKRQQLILLLLRACQCLHGLLANIFDFFKFVDGQFGGFANFRQQRFQAGSVGVANPIMIIKNLQCGFAQFFIETQSHRLVIDNARYRK